MSYHTSSVAEVDKIVVGKEKVLIGKEKGSIDKKDKRYCEFFFDEKCFLNTKYTDLNGLINVCII